MLKLERWPTEKFLGFSILHKGEDIGDICLESGVYVFRTPEGYGGDRYSSAVLYEIAAILTSFNTTG